MTSTAPTAGKSDVFPNQKERVQCACGCGVEGALSESTGHVKGCLSRCCVNQFSTLRRTAIKPTRHRKKDRPDQLEEESDEWHAERFAARVRSRGICAGNLLDLCDPCHRWVHAHPKISYDNGWLKHSWEVSA
jgi:hypothetical protein